MFVLNSDISIGQFVNVWVHDVSIKKSIFEYVDKAVIKLPISARIKNKNQNADNTIIKTVQTAEQFKAGDPVEIKLGYNGSLNTEFIGFVRRINFTSPLEVECEGYSYQLRIKTYQKTFKHAQLLDILKYLVEGTDIELDEKNIPGFVIDKLCLTGCNGCQALEEIKKISHDIVRIFFSGKRLWAGLLYLNATGTVDKYPTKETVKYRLGWNVIKDNNLKLRQSDGDVVMIYEGIKKDGSKETALVNGKVHTRAKKIVQTSGGVGLHKTVRTTAVTDAGTLKNMALAAQYKFNYDGYEGKITAFLQPYCEPAYMAFIEDLKYPERNGLYNVESVEVSYGMKGARRIVGIGIKLN